MIWLGGVATLVAVGVGLWWLRRRLLIVTVHGPSMAPTYRDGDRVLVRRVAGGQVRTGQVVVADLPHLDDPGPGEPSSALGAPPPSTIPTDAPSVARRYPVNGSSVVLSRVVKRVAAVAGELVPAAVDASRTVVPPGRLLLLGDNPSASYDSRHFGYVTIDAVIGVVRRHLR